MTSCYHGAKKFSSKQRPSAYKMSALTIASLISFFGEEQKSIKKGENHYKSSHVESFTYIQGILRGDVHASMRNKVYKVTVSGRVTDAACLFICCLEMLRSEIFKLIVVLFHNNSNVE